MKLSKLTREDKIRMALELGIEMDADGVTYNAVIPLIQKQSNAVKETLALKLYSDDVSILASVDVLNATPPQLLDALPVATGKAEV